MLSHRIEDALAAFEEVMTRFGSSLEPAFQIRMRKRLLIKGSYLLGYTATPRRHQLSMRS